MATPSTANMAAPTLARSQKVELFRSAWLTCLQDGEKKNGETRGPQMEEDNGGGTDVEIESGGYRKLTLR